MQSKSIRLFVTTALVLALAGAHELHASEARLLSLVPNDAVSVGLVKVEEMRRSPTAQRIIGQMNRSGHEGDAEQFLREAGLKPSEDLDVLLFAVSASPTPGKPQMLVAAAGRFDPSRLSATLLSRGAVAKNAAGVSYLVPPQSESGPENAAVSFVDRNLVIAGNERAVVAAIGALRGGGTQFGSSPLGREMRRVGSNASGWLLFDVQRSSALNTGARMPGATPFGDQAFAAIRNISIVALWANESREGLEFGSTAITTDDETRDLLADMLRGLLATWRMAAQEKQPEMVRVVRRFKVASGRDAVTLTGSVPAAMIEEFSSRVR
jgi:hypothetical protein